MKPTPVPEVKAIFINGGSIHYIFVGGVIGDSSFFSKMPLQGRETMMDNTLELRGRGLN